MSAQSTPIDLNAFLQPSFDSQALVAQLLANAELTAHGSALDMARSSAAMATSVGQLTATANGSNHDLDLPLIDSRPPPQTMLNPDQEEGDLSLAISRLNLTIDEIQNTINAQVEANAPQLLERMAGLSTMEKRLSVLRSGVGVLDDQVEGLRTKVHVLFVKLQQRQKDLKRVDAAADLISKATRFVTVARRLEAQMEVLFGGKGREKTEATTSTTGTKTGKTEEEEDVQDAIIGQVRGRELARAALIINEITSVLKEQDESSTRKSAPASSDDTTVAALNQGDQEIEAVNNSTNTEPSLLGLDFVKQYLPSIDVARQTVTDYMEDMVVRGLRDLSPIMLSSSLQTAYNLGTLPDLVRDLLADLTEVVKDRTRAAFDMTLLGRELGGLKEPSSAPPPPAYLSYYKGRRQPSHDPTSSHSISTLSTWTSALFRRLETLIVVEMGAVCSKVYTLEKVLRLKTDSETGVNFLEEALKVLGDRPSATFWKTLAEAFGVHSREAVRRWPFVLQVLATNATKSEGIGGGYTGLLRLFHQFFAKVAVYTDVVYGPKQQSPATVIVIRSLSHLETYYLDVSTTKISDLVRTALTGPRRNASAEEGENAVRAINNLLDATRFDPLLSSAVRRKVEEIVKGAGEGGGEKMAIRNAIARTLRAHDAADAPPR